MTEAYSRKPTTTSPPPCVTEIVHLEDGERWSRVTPASFPLVDILDIQDGLAVQEIFKEFFQTDQGMIHWQDQYN